MNAPGAAEDFRAKGVPHRRVEAWKYTDLKSAVDVEQVASATAAQWTLESEGAEPIDFHDGGFAGAMGEASMAFAEAGFGLRVAKAGKVRVNFATPGQARVRLVVEPGAVLEYIETAEGDGFQNIGLDVSIGEGAAFTHVRIAREGRGVRIEDVNATVAARGTYRLQAAHFGSELSRLELKIALNGESAAAHLSGVSVLDARHADITTHIVHAHGDTESTQLFKHVAAGRARAVYQGRITVAEGADGSDSRQTAKALLLDERAEADLKPELEIFADDVKCAHGAAVDDLDADSLFYLRARGIPDDEARGLLIRAFLGEAFDGASDETRALLWAPVEEAL
ncbi:MAG: SufD family Fe-S cluster assembly protein [Alphaproteobacteria bacterium]|nr:SufD family Fe-S cluster assembly protein [Alphaproteobacteria bacterium]